MLRTIYTIHDMIPLKFPYFVVDRGGRAVQLHREIARQADHIITVSQSSKQDIVDLLDVQEDRVSVTYQPAPSLPLLEQRRAERLVETIYGVRSGEYALFLGAIEPKKNLKRLIEAFLLAGVDIPLLLAGPLGWLYDEDLALLDAVGRPVRGRVGNGGDFGRVPTASCVMINRRSDTLAIYLGITSWRSSNVHACSSSRRCMRALVSPFLRPCSSVCRC